MNSLIDREGRRPRILIVDDEPFNVELLEQELELLNCATVAATDGEQALERLATESFDLVLLDIMMPKLDGFQALARMKADPELRHIPVIMISALSELDSVVRCIELGAEDHLPKPFEPTLLKARISASLENKRLRDQEREYLAEIDRQRKHAESLLHAILPAAAVEELIASGSVLPRRHEQVVVMFADVILLDLLMPGLDGFGVLAELKSDPSRRDIPVIVLTAKTLTAEDEALLRGGVLTVLEKRGLEREVLLREVRRALPESRRVEMGAAGT